MIKKKIEFIAEKIKENPDDTSQRKMEYIQGLIDDAVGYVKTVVIMGARIDLLRFRMEPEDYKIAVEQLDRTRKLAHDAFITKLNIINRICLQLDIEPLYEGPDHRADKGDFAFALVEEYRINVRG